MFPGWWREAFRQQEINLYLLLFFHLISLHPHWYGPSTTSSPAATSSSCHPTLPPPTLFPPGPAALVTISTGASRFGGCQHYPSNIPPASHSHCSGGLASRSADLLSYGWPSCSGWHQPGSSWGCPAAVLTAAAWAAKGGLYIWREKLASSYWMIVCS